MDEPRAARFAEGMALLDATLVDTGPLGLDDVVRIARHDAPVELSPAARAAMAD